MHMVGSRSIEQTVVVQSVEASFYDRVGKRLFDLVAGVILFTMAAPVIGVAWLAIRLTSRGYGFFSQKRVGRGGTTFRCYKLRSMYVDQHHRVDLDHVNESKKKGLLVKLLKDPRVTPVGRVIRKLSIDELPQLWNVVKGDMSLVGPRPLVLHMVAPFPELNDKRMRVKPGITGEWQIMERENNRSLEGMIKHDLHYVDNCTFENDLRIILRTVPVVLSTKGAH